MGSAAAVAAGVVPASLGTQTNGSVIRPAAFCGVVGFKPSFGRLPTDGVMTFSHTLDHVGVFARSVAGASLVMAALAGGSARSEPSEVAVGTTAPRLAAVRTKDWSSAQPAMKQRFEADLAALAAAGAHVETPALPADLDDALPVLRLIMAVEGFASLGSRVMSRRDLLSHVLADLLDEGAGTSEAAYKAALSRRERLIKTYIDWMADYDAVVTPPTTGEAPGLETTGDPRFCTRWTLVGAPAITLPTGFGPAGLPLGLQVVGRPGKDDELVAVARWVEGVLGRPTWHGPRPGARP
jgi:Asp-tRNA(Asn)/Glu-tRNA(Gln) amidotransferase A subunit family amidase